MFKKLPSRKYLIECFHYNEETGDLTWKARPESHFSSISSFKSFNNSWAGKSAGYVRIGPSGKSYIHIGISGVRYVAHRICAKIIGLKFSVYDEIDHIDGNGLNNSIKNIRVVSNVENGKNRKVYSSNSSGCAGVHLKSGGKWQARINHNGKRMNLGMFKDVDNAIKARKEAEKKYGYHENHGSDRPL